MRCSTLPDIQVPTTVVRTTLFGQPSLRCPLTFARVFCTSDSLRPRVYHKSVMAGGLCLYPMRIKAVHAKSSSRLRICCHCLEATYGSCLADTSALSPGPELLRERRRALPSLCLAFHTLPCPQLHSSTAALLL
ncbi:unnamed protein product [Protopolystoma xenopodis]|uniref:Uncharacterized protein n=1 Tax=Protopolystoma xenopodis TaxID=117903 RepID=A0A3S5B2N0_9PLAT|nr:unnamed protein product [Protopolystoma xenopodis]